MGYSPLCHIVLLLFSVVPFYDAYFGISDLYTLRCIFAYRECITALFVTLLLYGIITCSEELLIAGLSPSVSGLLGYMVVRNIRRRKDTC